MLGSDAKSNLCFVGDYTPSCNAASSECSTDSGLVGDLECAISNASFESSKAFPILLKSICSETIDSHHFIALNLANNHVYDAGQQAFDDMVTGLCNAIPNVQLYGLQETPYAEINLNNKHIAIIGCLEPCRSRGPSLFKEENVGGLVREIRNQYDFVFVTPHWGKEGEYAFHPSPWQRKLARSWIAGGVDGIFGHHSHTIHGHEIIDEKPVFYSLGNFLFNHEEGRKHPLTRLGLAVTYSTEGEGTWKKSFFIQNGISFKFITDDLFKQADSFLSKISSDISKTTWSMKRWAKTVGPIYISKSDASWKIRFRKDPFYKVLPLWLIWSLLPTNLLLRWGSMCTKDEIVAEAKQLDAFISKEAYPSYTSTASDARSLVDIAP